MSALDPQLSTALGNYLTVEERGPVAVTDARETQLHLGRSDREVSRLDIAFESPLRERTKTWSFLKEESSVEEISVMHALYALREHCRLPSLVWSGNSARGHCLVTAWLEGQTRSGFDLPGDVLEMLSRVHTTFRQRHREFAFLPQVDVSLWNQLLDRSARVIAATETDKTTIDALRRDLEMLRRDDVPRRLAEIPATLLHGDVHPANMMLDLNQGTTTLFDWSGALYGPFVIDLATCIPTPDSPSWQAYSAHVQDLTGEAAHRAGELEPAFHAATAFINIRRLGTAGSLEAARARELLAAALHAAANC